MEVLLRWEALLGPRGLGLATRVPHPDSPGMSLAGLPAGQDGRQAALPPTLGEPLADRQVGAHLAEDHREDLPAVDRVPDPMPTRKEGTTTERPPTRTARAPSTRGRLATPNSTV